MELLPPCGADCIDLPRIAAECACSHFDWNGARLIPNSFAILLL